MSRVSTWVDNVTGKLSSRLSIRISHDLSLSEMINGLGSHYGRDVYDAADTEFPQLSRTDMMNVIKAEYTCYGTNAVWTWTDHAEDQLVKAVELWAEDLILQHFPGLAEHRA